MAPRPVTRRLDRLPTSVRFGANPILRRIGDLVDVPTWVVGGFVRDRLLGLRTRDIDLAVDAPPGPVAAWLADALGATAFRLGTEPLAVWRIQAGGWSVDVWSINGDVEKDARRRDFTVNALMWRLPHGPLLDAVGGVEDIRRRRLVPVSRDNLAEDPLRALRGVRLLATHPVLHAPAETLEALGHAARLLGRVARERVVAELDLLLRGPAVARSLRAGSACGVLAEAVPCWRRTTRQRISRIEGLQRIARGRGVLAEGAELVIPATLVPERLTHGEEWEPAAACLAAVGWPVRAAQRMARAASLGDSLSRITRLGSPEGRALAVAAGELLPGAAAWLAAASPDRGGEAAALVGWYQRFAARPPLLRGDEIATLLGLGKGPARATAIAMLTLARARGEVRTPEGARRLLRSLAPFVDPDPAR